MLFYDYYFLKTKSIYFDYGITMFWSGCDADWEWFL